MNISKIRTNIARILHAFIPLTYIITCVVEANLQMSPWYCLTTISEVKIVEFGQTTICSMLPGMAVLVYRSVCW